MERHLALVTKLAASFPRDRIEKSTIIAYADALLPLKIETLEQVIVGVRDNSDRFPTIADIKRAYDDERERQAQRERERHLALPSGPPAPPPPEFKRRMAELFGAMDERAKELEPETP